MHWLLPRQCAWEMRRENFRPHGERAGLGPGTFRSELRPSTTALELTAFLEEKLTPVRRYRIQILSDLGYPGKRPTISVLAHV